jgi:hypothetical protein
MNLTSSSQVSCNLLEFFEVGKKTLSSENGSITHDHSPERYKGLAGSILNLLKTPLPVLLNW